jgi:hypothetical protein
MSSSFGKFPSIYSYFSQSYIAATYCTQRQFSSIFSYNRRHLPEAQWPTPVNFGPVPYSGWPRSSAFVTGHQTKTACPFFPPRLCPVPTGAVPRSTSFASVPDSIFQQDGSRPRDRLKVCPPCHFIGAAKFTFDVWACFGTPLASAQTAGSWQRANWPLPPGCSP